MPYGKSEDINKLKKKIEEQMPGLNVDNVSQNDVQRMLMNEINKDSSIDPSVKAKINNGDIDGLKEDLISYLSRNKNADSEKLVNMLKNNDMDGLKNQLMGMLMGSFNTQKKNEITGTEGELQSDAPPPSAFSLFQDNAVLNGIMGKAFDGTKSDNRVVFLNSMRPFVSEKRQKSIDDCVKIISMIALFEKFTNKVGN